MRSNRSESPRSALRRMLVEPGLTVLPGVYDALSAMMVERSGFPGAYMSGAAVSMSLGGVPDLGLLTMTEMASQASRLAGVLSGPLVADADTGFGNPLNVQRTVIEYERAGVAGLHIEDQTFPKRCGHLNGKSVIPSAEFEEKMRAAVEARTDPELVLIARTDARGPLGFAEAIRRANAYLQAGADMIFVEAPQSIDEISSIPAEVDGPVMYNIVENGSSPPADLDHLAEWGYTLAIRPLAVIAPVLEAILGALNSMHPPTPFEADLSTPGGLFETVDLDRWLEVGNRFGASSADHPV
ncbi:MAG TPA: isocitrate lyase/PEP mutase family protein [Acidimicrobiales bacterium]|nr:isocitrate lyase/PEP mutase family protein [Acidimicrobiales bacterium]